MATNTLTETLTTTSAALERTVKNAIDLAKSANGLFRTHDDVAVALPGGMFGHVRNGKLVSFGLEPIGVLPALQGSGVGTALMHAVLGAADAMDYALVALLGHLDYYPRFGFVPAESLGVAAPDPSWGAHFQARTLHAWTPEVTGTFRYAAPFDDLG